MENGRFSSYISNGNLIMWTHWIVQKALWSVPNGDLDLFASGFCAGSKIGTNWPIINHTLGFQHSSSLALGKYPINGRRYSVKMVKTVVSLYLNIIFILKSIPFIIIKKMDTTAWSPEFQYQLWDFLHVWRQVVYINLFINFTSIRWGW